MRSTFALICLFGSVFGVPQLNVDQGGHPLLKRDVVVTETHTSMTTTTTLVGEGSEETPSPGAEAKDYKKDDKEDDKKDEKKDDTDERPPHIYHPCFSPDHDAHNISQLSPSTSRDLYYSQGEDDDTLLSHMFADVNLEFKKPAIILESTDYIDRVTCSKQGLNIEFSSQEAYDYALDQWTDFSGASLKEDFILVSHSDGCETSSGEGQRTFWLVDETEFAPDARACAVKCKEIAVQEAANSMKATWGAFERTISDEELAKRRARRSVRPSRTRRNAAIVTPSPGHEAADLRNRGLGDIIDGAGDIIDGVKEAGEDVVDGAKVAVDAVVSPEVSKTLSLNLNAVQTNSAPEAPWSGVKAQKVVTYKDVDVYAADCGVTGKATVAGEASFSFTEMKITSGTFNLKGNMRASLGIGLVSESISKSIYSKKFNIAQIPLSPLTIPQIVTLGPYINVGGAVDFDAQASGNILATVAANFPSFSASVDLTDRSKNSQTGFIPTWTHNFEATGQITLSTTLGMPVEIGVGLTVPKIKGLNATVSVTNTPSLTAYGNFSNQAGPCQCGIGWGVNFKDSTALDVVGVYSPTLNTYQSPDLASGCVEKVVSASVCQSNTLANKKTEEESGNGDSSSSPPGLGKACTAGSAGAGTCTSTSSGCSGGTFHTGFCSGPSTVKCCVKKTPSGTSSSTSTSATTGVGASCTAGSAGAGTCATKSGSGGGCSGGTFHPGFCKGPTNVQCCVKDAPKSTTTSTDVGKACSAGSAGDGTCAATSSGCSGGTFHKGFCPGAANIQCCVKKAAANACNAGSAGPGTCKSTASGCSGGTFYKGFCPGAANIQCCVSK